MIRTAGLHDAVGSWGLSRSVWGTAQSPRDLGPSLALEERRWGDNRSGSTLSHPSF